MRTFDKYHRVAAVMDEFTHSAFSSECDLLRLHPINWQAQMIGFMPSLLFIESAWRGQDDLWRDKLAKGGREIIACVQWCQARGIPTVFWNKEDPVHFGTFLSLARHFDHVFTTDIDCIPRYMQALGHSRIGLLPFAAQPLLHNPMATLARKPAFNFAGSWYHRYPTRQRDFAALMQAASALGPVDIFDRNFGQMQPDNCFPDEYLAMVRGRLPFGQIDQAYKGYRFGLNVNTVKHSQSMFARRVFELMASNTVVVSNVARGLRLFFGDLVVAGDDSAALDAGLRQLWQDDFLYRKHRLMALRAVLREHTYAHRLAYVLARLQGRHWVPDTPEVLVLAVADSAQAEQRIVANLARQHYPACRLLLLRRYVPLHTGWLSAPSIAHTCFESEPDCLAAVQDALQVVPWMALFVAEDVYGPHYLTDLVQARHFSQADAFGKVAHFVARDGACALVQDGSQYLAARHLDARSALVRSSAVTGTWLAACLHDPMNAVLDCPNMLATDEFHYCRDGVLLNTGEVLAQVGDLPLAFTGLSLTADILPVAESLTAAHYRPPVPAADALVVKAAELYAWLQPKLPAGVSLAQEGDDLVVRSELPVGVYANLYAEPRFSCEQLNLVANSQIRLLVAHDLPELLTVFEYQDANKCKTGHTMNPVGAICTLLLPDACCYLRFALRLQGSGVARISALVFGETEDPLAVNLEGLLAMTQPSFLQTQMTNTMTSFFKSAQEAFDAGNFQQAIGLYEQAINERPELGSVYGFGLSRARASLAQLHEVPPVAVRPSVVVDQKTVFLEDLYLQVGQAAAKWPLDGRAVQPLVSVVMTAHNVQAYIEQAVTSVIRQTHLNIELVVVDDASTDDTWRILQRLAKEFPLVCRRLNANLGTYFAKNLGVKIARGEYVFFQDGDDICHPERIRLAMRELAQPGVACVQGCYSRVGFPSGQVYPVNGFVKKHGLITLGLRKEVFEKIGFFNCTTKAADNEFFCRLKLYCAHRGWQIRPLDLPLYYNTLRDGSLFTDMIANDPAVDGHIEQKPSPSRAAYVEAFTRVHKSLKPEQFREFFRYPVTRDLIPVAPDMTRLPSPSESVVLSLCSIPERQALLQRTLASLAPQVDEVHLYLDRYDVIPAFVHSCHAKVTVVLSKDAPALRDNGKFLPLLSLKTDAYYFTADDDIEYPPDYVNALLLKIEHYGRQAVVGLHGVLIPDQPVGYFSGFRRVLMFKNALEKDALVNNLGTGTVAFHTSTLRGLDYRRFTHAGMVDLYLAGFCKQMDIPMVAIARPDNWLVEMNSTSTSLFNEFAKDDGKQVQLVRSQAPWGYTAIGQTVAAVARRPEAAEAAQRLQALLPVLPQCMR
jgi:spore maturation protein CgeB